MAPSKARAPHPDWIDLGGGRTVTPLELIGKGSASSVYRAVIEGPHVQRRPVALKLFEPLATEELTDFVHSLERTASRLACVGHPNVVRIEEMGVDGQRPFLVTELVTGSNLENLIASFGEGRRRMPLDLAVFIATEIADALDGARTAEDIDGLRLQVLHLGLGPREVLLSWRGEVKVSDFEVMMTHGATSSVRNLGVLADRARSMAPEVARGLEGDARSDVFSLGVLLREILVGPRFPRHVGGTEAIRLAREGFIEPFSFKPHLPEELLTVVERALEPDPGHRFPNAGAMAYELRRVSLGLGVGDGRYFLRRALDHELGDNGNEVTAERAFAYERAHEIADEPVPDSFGEVRGQGWDDEVEEDDLRPLDQTLDDG